MLFCQTWRTEAAASLAAQRRLEVVATYRREQRIPDLFHPGRGVSENRYDAARSASASIAMASMARVRRERLDLLKAEQEAAGARSAPCLDLRTISDTVRLAQAKAETGAHLATYYEQRLAVYPTGEVQVTTAARRHTRRYRRAPAPPPRTGPRYSRGVSGRGRTLIRRAIQGRIAHGKAAVVMHTLTSQTAIEDADFKAAVNKFLKWCRAKIPMYFVDYVGVFELQQRGVLHCHLVTFKRIPKPLYKRMRDMWANYYGMGPGSFDSEPMRDGGKTWAYLAKYLGKDFINEHGKKVGRNGLEYVRDVFRGKAYIISDSMRQYAEPVTKYAWPFGSNRCRKLISELRGVSEYVTWHGCTVFYSSLTMARNALELHLSSGYN